MSDKTITVGIDKDEWYPVYSIVHAEATYATKCKIPKSLVKRHERALKEFDKVQKELYEAMEAAKS